MQQEQPIPFMYPVIVSQGAVWQNQPQPTMPANVPLHPVLVQTPRHQTISTNRPPAPAANAELAYAGDAKIIMPIEVVPTQSTTEEEAEQQAHCWELHKWSATSWFKFFLFLCLVGGIIALFTAVDVFAHLETFSDWADENQAVGLLSFMGGYALLTVVCFPGALLTIAAGLVFGVVKGVLATLVGATLGAALAFLMGRYLFKDVADRFTRKYKAMRAVDTVISRSAFRFTFLIRLSPIIPFTALNYCLSLTSVSFFPYIFATLLGIAPGTALFVYLGSTVMSLMEIQEGKVQQDKSTQILFWAGLAVTVLVTVVITRLARNQIRKEVAQSEAEAAAAAAASSMEAARKREEDAARVQDGAGEVLGAVENASTGSSH